MLYNLFDAIVNQAPPDYVICDLLDIEIPRKEIISTADRRTNRRRVLQQIGSFFWKKEIIISYNQIFKTHINKDL